MLLRFNLFWYAWAGGLIVVVCLFGCVCFILPLVDCAVCLVCWFVV